MRYYNLVLTQPNTSTVVRQYTSYPQGLNGPPDPGALNIEFDAYVSVNGIPSAPGASTITIEGIALNDLFQAQQFTGLDIALSGGMGPGLPLATPSQAGLLLQGTVFQSFGNWIGTEMTLDFVVTGSGYTLDTPGNFSFNWPSGSSIAAAVTLTLQTVFPTAKIHTAVNSKAVVNFDEPHVCYTLRQFATYILNRTQGLLGPNYPGVSICYQGGQFYVFDQSQAPTNIALRFQDLVGQPTWIQTNVVQFATVLRSDILVGNTITFPQGLQSLPGIATTTQSSLSGTQKYQSSFQGTFEVQAVRHVGNLRSTSALDWVSIFTCPVYTANG